MRYNKISMPTYNALPKPGFVTTPHALKQLVERLSRARVIAVDTESNSLYVYQEQVCLIQFSIPGQDYLVDPLSLEDLSPLGPLFGSPQVEKVFHAAEYDLLCLQRDFGFHIKGLFDTMVAARILGRDAVGLGSLLAEEFGVKVDKRYQRANWGQRPLPPEMLAYAQLDTHYLIELRQRLKAALIARQLWELAQEDFARQVHTNGLPQGTRNNGWWRVQGAHELEPQQTAVLQQLYRYRDQVARRINRPLFKVIHDKTLVAIASATPRQLDELSRLPGMSASQIHRHGKSILEAVEQGLQTNPVRLPRTPRPSDDYLERLDKLLDWRKKTARRMGVMSDVVMPRDLLTEIAERNPDQRADLQAVLKDSPWRYRHFGPEILELLQRNPKPY